MIRTISVLFVVALTAFTHHLQAQPNDADEPSQLAKADEQPQPDPQAEAKAKAVVEVIDRFRRNPTDGQIRSETVKALAVRHKAKLSESIFGPLLPLPVKAPEGLAAPEDLSASYQRARALFGDRNGNGLLENGQWADYQELRNQILAIYPHARVLYYDGVKAFADGEYQQAYDLALLADAVLFAEDYERRSRMKSRMYSPYTPSRRLAEVALSCLKPESQTPLQAKLHKMQQLDKDFMLLESDKLRMEIKEGLMLSQSVDYRAILEWNWWKQRNAFESDYARAFQDALGIDNQAELKRIADRMYERKVQRELFAADLLAYVGRQEDDKEYDNYFRMVMQNNPYNIYAWNMHATKRLSDNNNDEALLAFNTVAMLIDKQGNPRKHVGKLPAVRKALAKLEEPIKADLIMGYWNKALALEKASSQARATPQTYLPMLEATILRIMQIDPQRKHLYGLLAPWRTTLGDYDGAIRAASIAIANNPKEAASHHLKAGDAYRLKLPESTMDRDALKANYMKAIDHYRKAIKLGSPRIIFVEYNTAQMYETIEMVDESIVAYRNVAENADTGRTRGYAYSKIARLAYKHGKADTQAILVDLKKSLAAFKEDPAKSFIEITAENDATFLQYRLLRELQK
ncbi:MAG: hypothetical protein AB8C95_07920 [Phycisphaeraceae bacterium]